MIASAVSIQDQLIQRLTNNFLYQKYNTRLFTIHLLILIGRAETFEEYYELGTDLLFEQLKLSFSKYSKNADGHTDELFDVVIYMNMLSRAKLIRYDAEELFQELTTASAFTSAVRASFCQSSFENSRPAASLPVTGASRPEVFEELVMAYYTQKRKYAQQGAIFRSSLEESALKGFLSGHENHGLERCLFDLLNSPHTPATSLPEYFADWSGGSSHFDIQADHVELLINETSKEKSANHIDLLIATLFILKINLINEEPN
ncbi:hypothetical protein C7T94_03895 [Pedobacter yulinensis]|uniref:Uncharacterized protein n=1 Tax=Pedobacter yulinensis TaxID=2126353 RepID=A0A2T3HN61_9SPHI|nr:hypothetical protein [Pedobacter yulinensis]PST83898.1 hypothetical protein C7T94_03895 [Pedobacter yulinensis]